MKYYAGIDQGLMRELVFSSFNLVSHELEQLETFILITNPPQNLVAKKEEISWQKINFD